MSATRSISQLFHPPEGPMLEEAGFGTGTPVNVRVMPAHLLLSVHEPAPEQPAEPEVVTTLKRACKKLSARKQREIAAFIEWVATPQKRPRKILEEAVKWRGI